MAVRRLRARLLSKACVTTPHTRCCALRCLSCSSRCAPRLLRTWRATSTGVLVRADMSAVRVLQLGDVRGAVETAQRLLTEDPGNKRAAHVVATCAAPPAELVALLTPQASTSGCRWPAASAVQSQLEQQALSAALPLVLDKGIVWRHSDEAVGMEWQLAGEGDPDVRLQLRLDTLEWAALARQAAQCLERMGKQGSKRVRQSKTMRTEERRALRTGTVPPPRSFELLAERRADNGAAEATVDFAATAAPEPADRNDRETPVAAAASEAGEVVRAKKVADGRLPTAASDAADGPTGGDGVDDGKDGKLRPLANCGVRPALLSKPVRIIFRGLARLHAVKLLEDAMEIDSDDDDDIAVAAPSATSPPPQPHASSEGAVAHDGDRSSAEVTAAPLRATGLGAGHSSRHGGGGGRGRSSRRQALRAPSADGATSGAATSAELSAEQLHKRNVMHLLGPALLADSHLGPIAVPAVAEATADAPPEAAGPSAHRAAATGAPVREVAGAVRCFLRGMLAERGDDCVTLSVNITTLAQRIIAAICTAAAAGTCSRDTLEALLQLDAACTAELPAAGHLILSELCLDAATALDAPDADTAAVPGTKRRLDGTPVAPGRGRPRDAATEEMDARNARSAAALHARAAAHLALFHTRCICASSAEAAAANGTMADERRTWHVRALWLNHRTAWQHGDLDGALLHLAACEAACAADGSTEPPTAALTVHLPWCAAAPVISAASAAAARQQLHVHQLLADLPGRLAAGSVREVMRQVAAVLFTDAAAARRLFASRHAYARALSHVFTALTSVPAPPPGAPVGGASAAAPPTLPAPAGTAAEANNAEQAPTSLLPVRPAPTMVAASSTDAAPARDAVPANSKGAHPKVLGDLTSHETAWMQAACALQHIAALLPLERTVAKPSTIVVAGSVTPQAVLVRPPLAPFFVRSPLHERRQGFCAPSCTHSQSRAGETAPSLL